MNVLGKIMVLALLAAVVSDGTAPAAANPADIEVVNDAGGSFVFAYTPAVESVREVELDGSRYRVLRILGAGSGETVPGRPDYPVRVVLYGIRPGATVRARLVESAPSTLDGPPLLPVPNIIGSPDRQSPPRNLYRPGALYGRSGLYPAQAVSVAGYRVVRGLHVAEIHLHPLRQEGSGGGPGTVRFNRRMVVEITASGGRDLLPASTDRAWEPILEDAVINYNRARNFVGRPRPAETREDFPPTGEMVKLLVAESGLHKVTGADLAAAGLDLASVDPAKIRLLATDGLPLPLDTVRAAPQPLRQVACIINNGGDPARLDSDDEIIFYAVAPADWADRIMASAPADRWFRHPYVNQSVYWIAWGPSAETPARIATSESPAAAPDFTINRHTRRLHIEENRLYNSSWEYEGVFGDPRHPWDPWYWKIQKSDRIDYHFIADPPLASDSVVITAAFKGRTTDSSHRARLYLNGISLGETLWDTGRIHRTVFPAAGLVADTNLISVEHLVSQTDEGLTDEIYVNYFDLSYARRTARREGGLFLSVADGGDRIAGLELTGFTAEAPLILDITDRYSPVFLTPAGGAGGDYSVKFRTSGAHLLFVTDPAGLRTPSRIELRQINPPNPTSVNYLLIAHDSFATQAARLADWRGRAVAGIANPSARAVATSTIYDLFSGGALDPAAVRNFLAWCYFNWDKPPAYACFLGDAVLDFHNFSGADRLNLVPAYTRPTGVMFIQGYDTDEAIEDWFAYLDGDDKLPDIIVGRIPAANDDHATIIVDKVVDYESRPEFGPWRARTMLVADDERTISRTGEIVHTRETELIANSIVLDDLQVERLYLMDYPRDPGNQFRKSRARLDLLDAFDDGRLFVNYIGHGSEFQWAHEHILEIADIRSFDNGARLPLVYAPSCDIAKFDRFEYDAMGEEFLRVEGRGAAAVIASSRLGYIGPNEDLNQQFYRKLFAAPAYDTSLGRALVQAKLSRGENSNDRRYSVFGDPATRLALPAMGPDRIQLKVESAYGDTLRKGGIARLSGTVGNADGSPFSGFCNIEIRDSSYRNNYTNPESTVVGFDYVRDGLPIFHGPVEVVDGSFQTDFRVPVTARPGPLARVQTYVWNQNNDAAAAADSIPLFGTAEDSDDETGPQIEITVGEDLAPAELVQGKFTVTVRLNDPAGISINSNPHRWSDDTDPAPALFLAVTLKEQEATGDTINLIPSFSYILDSNTRGIASADLDLAPGIYSLTVLARDNLDNQSSLTRDLEVTGDALLQIRQVVNYPNPITENTWFTYQLTHPADVSIRVYTIAGRLIKTIQPAAGNFDYNQEFWDGADQDGDRIANGVYLYKITASAMISDQFGRLKRRRTDFVGKLFVYR